MIKTPHQLTIAVLIKSKPLGLSSWPGSCVCDAKPWTFYAGSGGDSSDPISLAYFAVSICSIDDVRQVQKRILVPSQSLAHHRHPCSTSSLHNCRLYAPSSCTNRTLLCTLATQAGLAAARVMPTTALLLLLAAGPPCRCPRGCMQVRNCHRGIATCQQPDVAVAPD